MKIFNNIIPNQQNPKKHVVDQVEKLFVREFLKPIDSLTDPISGKESAFSSMLTDLYAEKIAQKIDLDLRIGSRFGGSK